MWTNVEKMEISGENRERRGGEIGNFCERGTGHILSFSPHLDIHGIGLGKFLRENFGAGGYHIWGE